MPNLHCSYKIAGFRDRSPSIFHSEEGNLIPNSPPIGEGSHGFVRLLLDPKKSQPSPFVVKRPLKGFISKKDFDQAEQGSGLNNVVYPGQCRFYFHCFHHEGKKAFIYREVQKRVPGYSIGDMEFLSSIHHVIDYLALILAVANEVMGMHKKQVIHRDLNMSNIFAWRNEKGEFQCQLIDFGIAAKEGDSVEKYPGKGTNYEQVYPLVFKGDLEKSEPWPCSPVEDLYSLAYLFCCTLPDCLSFRFWKTLKIPSNVSHWLKKNITLDPAIKADGQFTELHKIIKSHQEEHKSLCHRFGEKIADEIYNHYQKNYEKTRQYFNDDNYLPTIKEVGPKKFIHFLKKHQEVFKFLDKEFNNKEKLLEMLNRLSKNYTDDRKNHFFSCCRSNSIPKLILQQGEEKPFETLKAIIIHAINNPNGRTAKILREENERLASVNENDVNPCATKSIG